MWCYFESELTHAEDICNADCVKLTLNPAFDNKKGQGPLILLEGEWQIVFVFDNVVSGCAGQKNSFFCESYQAI